MTTNTEWAVRYERSIAGSSQWETITYVVRNEEDARSTVAVCTTKHYSYQRNYQVVRRTITDWESV